MVGSLMTFLIIMVAMIIACFEIDFSIYSGLIVCYGYCIQLLMTGAIEMLTDAEGEMPAVERMMEYGTLEDETETHNKLIKEGEAEPDPNNQGITIKNLKMKYRPELPYALNGVDIHINPREHVAIVGRTGSGKSSLAITLFKLY